MKLPSKSPSNTLNLRDVRAAALLVVGFTCLYIFTASINAPNIGDSKAMLDVSVRILEHGFEPLPNVDNRDSFSRAGLGQSLIDLPIAWAYRRARNATNIHRLYYSLIVSTMAAAVAATINTLLFLTCRMYGYDRPLSVVLALVSGLATMTWVYSQVLLADVTLGACFLLCFFGLSVYASTGRCAPMAMAGGSAAFAALTKVVAWLIVPILTATAIAVIVRRIGIRDRASWRAHRSELSRPLLYFALPTAIILGVNLWYNALRYGSWWTFGYDFGRDADFGFNTPLLTGVFGLLFSSGKSLFWYNPPLLLSLVAIPAFFRRFTIEALGMLAVITTMILVHAKWWAWSGDWAWGPRFLVSLPPLFLLMSAEWCEQMRRCWPGWRAKRVALTGALVVSVSCSIQIAGLVLEPSRYIQLTTNEAKVFEGGFYHPTTWPIRDDTLQLHFIPEFSPIIGHFWMFRCILFADDPALRQSPPWRKMNPKWVPEAVHDSYFQHNIWWLFSLDHTLPLILCIAAVLFIVTMVAMIALVRLTFSRSTTDYTPVG